MPEPSQRPHVADDVLHYQMHIHDVQRGPRTDDGFEPIVQHTTRGPIEMRYYPAPRDRANDVSAPASSGAAYPAPRDHANDVSAPAASGAAASVAAASGATSSVATTRGAIFVGGAGGGFDTPVRGWLYPRLCQQLQGDGISALRVRYREPNDLEESVLDVLAGISFLEADHVTAVALVGHSFGGAVVIQAAALSGTVRTCVALSTQSYGADPAAQLAPRCSLLLAHGLADEILPADCSRHVHDIAREPKRLLLKENARHGLDEWSDALPALLREWIRAELEARPPSDAPRNSG